MDLVNRIERFLDVLVKERGLSPETVRAYRSDLGKFREWTIEASGRDHPDVTDIDQGTVRGFVVSLHRAGYARTTIGRRIAAVKAFCKYLVLEGVLDANPAADITTPKTPSRLPTVLTTSEVERLLSLPDDSTSFGLRDKTVLELLYSTGLRRSELCQIRAQDLMDGGTSVRVLGKGQKDRVVPIGSVARRLLNRWIAVRPDIVRELPEEKHHSFVFVRDDGMPLDGNILYAIVRHYMAQVTEQKKTSPHVLRHSFATHMLDAGAGLREVGELLGHSSLGTTQVYTHVTVDRLKSAYRKAHPRAGESDESPDGANAPPND
jgi:site-specific recombinase XerD